MKRWRNDAALLARAQLRAQGLNEPLKGHLLILAVFSSRGVGCDWDNGLKDTCDALNTVAWVDDRQIVCGTGMVARNAAEDEVAVYIVRASERVKYLHLLAELLESGASPLWRVVAGRV